MVPVLPDKLKFHGTERVSNVQEVEVEIPIVEDHITFKFTSERIALTIGSSSGRMIIVDFECAQLGGE